MITIRLKYEEIQYFRSLFFFFYLYFLFIFMLTIIKLNNQLSTSLQIREKIDDDDVEGTRILLKSKRTGQNFYCIHRLYRRISTYFDLLPLAIIYFHLLSHVKSYENYETSYHINFASILQCKF